MDRIKAIDMNKQVHDVAINELLIRVSAYGFVIKDNKILLLSYGDSGYDLPGGGIELGETPEQAVKREIYEETGIKVKIIRKAGFDNSFYKPHYGEKTWQSIALYFSCKYIDGKLSNRGFDKQEKEIADEAKWIPLKELSTIKIASSMDFRTKVEL